MKYKIIVDKQSRTNPSDEKKEYVIDIEELRVKGAVYDSLIITKEEDYVMRRLSLSEYHVLSVLEEPIKETIPGLNIELFEGDNYIYLVDMIGNKFYAEYLIKNDFTDIYCTKNEMNSAINQTAQSIELSVNQKLTSYATNEEVENSVTELNSKITQTAENISSEVSKKVGNDEIISKINQSAEEIQINADKINIDGKAARFTTEINEKFGPFVSSDIERIKKIVMKEITPTSSDYEKYDIDGDKKITIIDWFNINKAVVKSGGYLNQKGKFSINPYSSTNSLSIYDTSYERYTAMLGIIKSYFHQLNIGDSLEIGTIENEENLIIYPHSIYLRDSVKNLGAHLGFMGFNNEDTYEFSIYKTNSDKTTIGRITMYLYNGEANIDLYGSNNEQTYIKNTGITTPSVTQTSREESKKNFEKLQNGLDIINDTEIYKYNLKSQADVDKKHIGFVIGENYKYSKEITSVDKEGKEVGVDTYSMISVAYKAIQEQQEQIEQLQEKYKQKDEIIDDLITRIESLEKEARNG